MMDGPIPPPSSTSSSSSATLLPPSNSSSSSVFRPRRSDDWNEYRPAIEHLYRDKQLKLRDVKRAMEKEYKFFASEKQYKDRLASWNIRKNIKAKEVHIMLRKQQKRAAEGKQTVFRVAGQDIDTKRISRFVRRYGTNVEANNSRDAPLQSPPVPQSPLPFQQAHHIMQTQSLLQTPILQTQPFHAASPEPATPSDMSYGTPPPDERGMTLSPSTETHSQFHDDRSESTYNVDTNHVRSLSVSTASAFSTDTIQNEPSRPVEDAMRDNMGWPALDDFQKHLMKLQRTLDQSMSRFVSHEERLQQEAQAELSRSTGQ
ncbi:hypothetical protein BO70DRAFT_164890 [Aspergillus heteromorphus CBS 117.55]|uniref:Clr5 domain-containing protein n=1 Tax=Aspergillus heteromorphus CBS 117.55 TaxID=1448321 RepID=A0A317WTZ6_9EURO|nr:uncharacterized protein BO70DRAFT_164890 [Aspergillus heteromorphus CBS 117.55]PWY89291.1 hypothetical protein BO70DRAFT_164890 [Aspergillus heteromorphus CBS 117.55]